MTKQSLIKKLESILAMHKELMYAQNGRPDCKNCSLAENIESLLEEQNND